MHLFDPRDWKAWTGGDGPELAERNRHHLLRVVLAGALSLFLASLLPPSLVPDTLAALLLGAGMGAAALARARDEDFPSLDAPHLTWWDESAACIALGLLAKVVFPAPAVSHAAAVGVW
jgi:hypothetical protein